MMKALEELKREIRDGAFCPEHAGLAYERGAPLEPDTPKATSAWLDALVKCRMPAGYPVAFGHWQTSLTGPGTLAFYVRTCSRLLIGHGNPTWTEVGLTLHHTWGVPVLPGSALKGLTSNYVQAAYGPDAAHPDPERELFRGVVWEGSRVRRGPGDVNRRIFGAPDADADEAERSPASRGEIVFHDALWIPSDEAMLARDVLTVHQKTYYGEQGATWPTDHDDPNPVAFLTVPPANTFWVVLSLVPGASEGGDALLQRAKRYVLEALREWGLGGKTSAGYGRFEEDMTRKAFSAPKRARAPEAPIVFELEAWLQSQKDAGVTQREQMERLDQEWMERLVVLPPEARGDVTRVIRRFLNPKKPQAVAQLERLVERLAAGR